MWIGGELRQVWLNLTLFSPSPSNHPNHWSTIGREQCYLRAHWLSSPPRARIWPSATDPSPPPPSPTLHRQADGTAWKNGGGGGEIKPTFLPSPPLPLPITHIMLKWMNKWMNEWMNEQTNECKNTKNTIHFPPPPVRGGELFPPAAHMYIYIAKKYTIWA